MASRQSFSRFRFMVAALLCAARFAVFGVVLAAAIWMWIGGKTVEIEMIHWWMGGLGLGVVITVLLPIFASGAKCPRCQAGTFGVGGCSRHQDARRFLGSYSLSFALSVLLYPKTLLCHYCGERFRFSHKESYNAERKVTRGRAMTRTMRKAGRIPAGRQPSSIRRVGRFKR